VGLGRPLRFALGAATGRPLTDDELRLIGRYPYQLALLYPGLLD
jgi:homocitrate synthase NifV